MGKLDGPVMFAVPKDMVKKEVAHKMPDLSEDMIKDVLKELSLMEIEEEVAAVPKEYEEGTSSVPEEYDIDMVDNPKHYQIFPEYGVEVMDIITRAIQLSGVDGRKAYLLGNALKYLLRVGRKGDVKTDAGKARHYCQRLEDD